MNFQEIINKASENNIQDIQIAISKIFKSVNYGSIVQMNQTFNGLYRARKHSQIDGENNDYLFTNEREFWSPPLNSVTKLGRCNNINESMFYSSNNFETAILEVRPEVDKFISVAHFKPIKLNGNLPSFIIKPICINDLKKIDDYGYLIPDTNYSTKNKEFDKVDSLIDELFTKNINDDSKYKVTIAITKCMLVNIINKNGKIDFINGMIYPSIANKKNSINILLKPIYAEISFNISLIQTFKILKVTDKKIKIKLVRNGYVYGSKNKLFEKSRLFWFPEIDGDVTDI